MSQTIDPNKLYTVIFDEEDNASFVVVDGSSVREKIAELTAVNECLLERITHLEDGMRELSRQWSVYLRQMENASKAQVTAVTRAMGKENTSSRRK
jgi:inorganic pyrophosphatase